MPQKYFNMKNIKIIHLSKAYKYWFQDHYYHLLFGLLYPYVDTIFGDEGKQLDLPESNLNYFNLFQFIIQQQNEDWQDDELLSNVYSQYLSGPAFKSVFKKTYIEFIRNLDKVSHSFQYLIS